jgi:hypothetical protein
VHPFRRCHACKGSGRHNGAIFGYAERQCRRCGGSLRQERLGTRVRRGRDRQHMPGR